MLIVNNKALKITNSSRKGCHLIIVYKGVNLYV